MREENKDKRDGDISTKTKGITLHRGKQEQRDRAYFHLCTKLF